MRWKFIIAGVAVAGASCLAQAPVQLKVVKNSPFSAQAVTQSTQELADGNRIVRTSVASIARDSEGRTRREQNLPEAGLASTATAVVVFIHDPTAGVAYVLEPQPRLARKIAISAAEIVKLPPDIQGAVSKAEPTGIKTESMGTQIVEGLLAEGTRITKTLAAGQTGNERSLEIVSETWYSTDLQTILMSRTTDPRLGETVYRLTGIQRGEPLHSLFEVPAEYTIRDEPPSRETRPIEKSRSQ